MNTYETLLQEAVSGNVKVHEAFDLNGDTEPDKRINGIYIDGTIALDERMETSIEKKCILAEELGHHYTATGNILDLNSAANRKVERLGRAYAYNKLVGLLGIIKAYECGCRTQHDMAECLEVTEEFLSESLSYYRQKYGCRTSIDNYAIFFEPNLAIMKII